MNLVVPSQCSHPKVGRGSSPCWMRIRNLGSLLSGGGWPPGYPRINTPFLSASLCPGPGCVAFIHGLLCPLASRWMWPISGAPGGRWRPWAPPIRVAMGRQRPSVTSPSCHPPIQASIIASFPCPFRPQGRSTWGRNEAPSHPGLPGTVLGVCTQVLGPRKPPSPRQIRTVDHSR